MLWQNHIVEISGIVIIFFYCLCRFNNPPPARSDTDAGTSKTLVTIKQWFQFHDPPTPMVLPPSRANTTAFKFWLYRMVYAFFGVFIFLLLSLVPGLRDPIPALITLFKLPVPQQLDLANGVVLALLLVVLSRMPPLRAVDATIRRELYERASIPAQQLSFQFLLRNSAFNPNPLVLTTIRDELTGDSFAAVDIHCHEQSTTPSLWTKINVLMHQLERWAQEDQYKTAFSIIREPETDKLLVDRVRDAREALKADARLCLAALREKPDVDDTLQRDEQFRQECKALLDALYNLITRVMLRSHFSYFDAITAVKRAGFDVSVSAMPLPNKNDLVALILLFFFVVTVPLSYGVGFYRATMITVIYVLATLTPIYLAAEWPNLLRRDERQRHMPPLAFPILSSLLAGTIGCLVAVIIGSVQTEAGTLGIDVGKGLTRWMTVSYPWTILISGITGVLSVLMLIGRYPDNRQINGAQRYRQWICLSDGLILAAFTLALMLFLVFPMLVKLVPQHYSWENELIIARPVLTAFFIGLLVPTWYRGNRELLKQEKRRVAPVIQGGYTDAVSH